MDDGYSPLSWMLLIGFIVLEACFYGFGAAIQNVNAGKLEQDMEAGSRKAGSLLRIVNRPTRFVNAIQIMTHLVGIVTGAYILMKFQLHLEALLGEGSFLEGRELVLQIITMAAAALFLLVVLVSFGIIIPKRCAARKPEEWGYKLMPMVMFLTRLFLPVIALINGISWMVLKLAGIDMNSGGENVTEEDIMSMVNEGHEQGVVEADEAEMITNIFQLNDKEAGDIMTHRINVEAIDCHMTLGQVVDFILKEGSNSRYPVYEKDIDDIIGLLHMKDALLYADNEENRDKPLSDIPGLLREPHFIPETRSIDTLFREMQAQKIHMEIVVDEYGQTAGIVTMEDILEEIVGNIMDEYDEEEELILANPDGSFLLEGMTLLEDVEHALGITFEEEDSETYDTLNGFLISRLKRIPKEGERPEVRYQGYEFRILKVENKMIHSVRAVKIPEWAAQSDEPENEEQR
ncbi:MAG: hemolysin family protein [Lachnospiraceae bacterium]|nr:hemolysin family protein [Lachnospiraceae bacterium]